MAKNKNFNIDEAEDFDDGTRAVSYDNDDLKLLGSDSENENAKLSSSRKQRLQSKKTKQKERASSLRVKNWDTGDLDDADYAGKVVKRKDVSEVQEEEDDDEGSPDEDAMGDWSDAEPFGASDDGEGESDGEPSDFGESSDDDGDEDQDAEKLIRGFEKEDSAQLMSAKDSAKLVEKASHVRHQKIIWERCLEVQIHTKRFLTTTKTIADVEDADEDKKKAAIEQIYACIDAVSGLQDKLCNSSELSAPQRATDATKKRKRSVEDVWSGIMESNQHALPQYNEILNTYTRKTNLAGGNQAKKFKAVNQDILAQVESVLADPQRVKRKAHAPVDTEGENGNTTAEDDSDDMQLDELMYDDSDFYQQLLKEFIESGGGNGAQEALLRRQNRKKKKNVNRKASKGRVIRYTVHPKLENFMFPEPYPASQLDVDELFRSLFGQARQA
ncbi:hypothetical protein Poli38472_005902 [Pythium oligandrum]|uniref:Uncharacterized protein n=1 Tax=Pythium oligandrum TaxID=41045 RepID=A0A8K1CSJ1_PYTOL|nr:hypothetical protein Poli38472_005902 [Pythium oligandrum]|eukprot:TMW68434.1 hypothetical protein Poli38472_005902 [Pythium oligandrum]